VPALPSCLTEPIWEQIQSLLPDHHDYHPLRCHRPWVPDRVVFDLLINALVFGAGYRRIADERCSATTLRRRRDEWIAAGVMDRLEQLARDGYDKLIGLELHDVAVDGCSTKWAVSRAASPGSRSRPNTSWPAASRSRAAALSASTSASLWADPRSSSRRDPRLDEYTICTATAPDDLFTVRM
jgi:transposase